MSRTGNSRIGQGEPRREDERLLRGEGRYAADIRPDDVLHIVFARSTMPRCRIVECDIESALESDGGVAVYTGHDVGDALQRRIAGPLDADGEALGGEVFFVLNEELYVPLWRSLAGVVFFDAGNVWATKSAIDSRLFTSVGLGLRSPSPIGPLRLDVAVPLDRRPEIDPSAIAASFESVVERVAAAEA